MAIEVRVPDIGDYQDIPIIDILVKAGDHVAAEDPLITLESDKATMDVPAPAAGVVQSITVKLGDKVSQGSLILMLEAEGVGAAAPAKVAPPPPAAVAPPPPAAVAPTQAPAASPAPAVAPVHGGTKVAAPAGPAAATLVCVPDIGDYQDIPVIDLLVKAGDTVAAEDALVTLESDKATMDVPAPAAGVVQRVLLKVGDKVSQGTPILELLAASAATTVAAPAQAAVNPPAPTPAAAVPAARPVEEPAAREPAAPAAAARGAGVADAAGPAVDFRAAHASPSVRRFARELGVDLNQVKGTGPKDRITEDDVKAHVKRTLQAPPASAAAGPAAGGLDLLPWPVVDFTRFGEVEVRPLSRIKKLSGANLHRNWVRIPHVTNQDEADITDLEALRNELNAELAKSGVKLTALAFLIKAVTVALRQYPEFNASLDGDTLVLKRYFHIGFAADTPNGLVVPVLRNADRKGVIEIARESSELAGKAREGKLGPADMQGGCFSISSLGGIGGGHFTPIINAPEVAILGVGRAVMRPVWDGQAFAPRLMLPLSLSYDHRVIDGAAAARFNALLTRLLADMRRALL